MWTELYRADPNIFWETRYYNHHHIETIFPEIWKHGVSILGHIFSFIFFKKIYMQLFFETRKVESVFLLALSSKFLLTESIPIFLQVD